MVVTASCIYYFSTPVPCVDRCECSHINERNCVATKFIPLYLQLG